MKAKILKGAIFVACVFGAVLAINWIERKTGIIGKADAAIQNAIG